MFKRLYPTRFVTVETCHSHGPEHHPFSLDSICVALVVAFDSTRSQSLGGIL